MALVPHRSHPRPTPSLLIVLAVCLVVGASSAHPPPYFPPRWPPAQDAYNAILETPAGRPLRTFHHRGRLFVLGHYGARYNVRLINHTGRRVEAVLSVDGRDAVSGDVADFVRHRGYLVPAHGSVVVEGFRTSLDGVAAFRFTDRTESYSALRGTPQNVGVIGVAFFPERARRPPPRWDRHARPYGRAEDDRARETQERPPHRPRSEARKSGARGDRAGSSRPRRAEPHRRRSSPERYRPSMERFNLGTEYGEERESPAVEVPFRRESPLSPARIVRVYYDDIDGLTARGIRVDMPPRLHTWDSSPDPEPFPERGFAPRPR